MNKAEKKKLIDEARRKKRLKLAIDTGLPFPVLAIDPATQTGWAMSLSYFGTWDFKLKRNETMGMKLLRFEQNLQIFLKKEGVKALAFEMPVTGKAGATIHHSKLNAIIEKVCADLEIQYIQFTPSEVKKFATGKGNSGKPAMIAAAKEMLGYKGNNDNEADALWILMLLRDYFNKSS